MSELKVPSHVPADRVIDFDISNDPGLKHDVFARLEQLRDSSPKVAYSPYNGGHWLCFDREMMQRIFADGETFSCEHIGGGDDGPGMIPLSLNPPHHAPWRHLLLKHFGPKEVRNLESFVRSWAERLIAKVEGQSSVDFLKAVAEPMPVSVFMEIMGLPLSRFDEFRGLAVTTLTPPESEADIQAQRETLGKITTVLHELIEDRKREPKDDLVSKLLADTFEGRKITDAEMMSICYLQFLAGLDTVTNAMTYGMRHLARNPEFQAEIRADRSKIPDMIEKMLRLYTFVNTHRLVKKDIELDGVQIKKGEMLWSVLWSGSNDPTGEQDGPRHMAFGGGHHMCLGMHLARLELRVMYETWFDRIGEFSLAPDSNPKPAMRGGTVMNITRLPLALAPLKAAA